MTGSGSRNGLECLSLLDYERLLSQRLWDDIDGWRVYDQRGWGAKSMVDEQIYAQIADELARSDMDKALWTQAIALADGDDGKTKAAYIKLRHKALVSAARASEEKRAEANAGAAARLNAFAADPKLIDMLAASGKKTLYSALKLSPGASQSEVDAVCTQQTEQLRSGQTVADAATITYAVDTLSNVDRRRAYDLSLLRGLQPSRPVPPEPVVPNYRPDIGASAFLEWWGTGRLLAVLVVFGLIIVGALFLTYRNQAAKRDVDRTRAQIEQAKAASSAQTEAERVQVERTYVQGTLDNQGTAVREGARIADRHYDVQGRAETRRSTELEYKASATHEGLNQSRTVINNQETQASWTREQYEQERTRAIALQEQARDRATLIATYLGRNQFQLAREVAKTREEITMIERAEATEAQRQAQNERASRYGRRR